MLRINNMKLYNCNFLQFNKNTKLNRTTYVRTYIENYKFNYSCGCESTENNVTVSYRYGRYIEAYFSAITDARSISMASLRTTPFDRLSGSTRK